MVSQAGGYPKMIATLFPSIHFDETKFMLFPGFTIGRKKPNLSLYLHLFYSLQFHLFLSLYSVGFWTNVDNRKKFLEDFAKKNRFDPLIAENWYKIRTKQFRAMKVLFLSPFPPFPPFPPSLPLSSSSYLSPRAQAY